MVWRALESCDNRSSCFIIWGLIVIDLVINLESNWRNWYKNNVSVFGEVSMFSPGFSDLTLSFDHSLLKQLQCKNNPNFKKKNIEKYNHF